MVKIVEFLHRFRLLNRRDDGDMEYYFDFAFY